MVRQFLGEYEARELRITQYADKTKQTVKKLNHFKLQRIVRADNTQADALSRLVTLDPKSMEGSVYLETMSKSSLDQTEIMAIDGTPNWMTPIIRYLKSGDLPKD